VHGMAVGLMLPGVVRFNGRDSAAQQAYAELASAPEIACASDGHESAWQALIARLEAMLALADMPSSLGDCGAQKSDIPILAREAAQQWTANFNPRRMTAADFELLYSEAFEPRK